MEEVGILDHGPSDNMVLCFMVSGKRAHQTKLTLYEIH